MDLMTILVTISSGLLGALLGIFLSPYINYKYSMRLVREEIIFKEKVKNYEKIRNRIETLYGVYKKINEEKIEEVKQTLQMMNHVMNAMNQFDQLKKDYLSHEIKNLLEEYHLLIKEYNEKDKFTKWEIFELTKKFNKYTNKISTQIDKEIGLKLLN
ncbi:MAG: hypothetical protein WC511_03405 [Candidatus Pacearchaeota archaeon]